MAVKLKLSAEDISNYKFQNVPRGYDALEVDKFLDTVINDYLLIEESKLVDKKELEAAQQRIAELEEKNKGLALQIGKMKASAVNIKDNGNVNVDNIQILKRINALEKYLWKQGINPETIK